MNTDIYTSNQTVKQELARLLNLKDTMTSRELASKISTIITEARKRKLYPQPVR